MTDDSFIMALLGYIKAYENLTIDTIKTDLLPRFAVNAYFEDPFNQVVGHHAIETIFKDMFANTCSPEFDVLDYAIRDNVAFLRWEFNFLDSRSRAHHIEGTSVVTFNSQHEVKSHVDYWDTGKYLYLKIPLLRWVIGKINRRLSVTAI